MSGFRRSRLALPVKEYKALLHRVFTRDKWKCRVPGCGRRSDLHGHHLLFRSKGGDDAVENLLTVCNHCHASLHGNAPKRDQLLVIMPFEEDKPYDANGDLKFLFVNGWRPNRRVC